MKNELLVPVAFVPREFLSYQKILDANHCAEHEDIEPVQCSPEGKSMDRF